MGYGHPKPVYYYVPIFFGVFFPWSCFLPFSFKSLLAHGLRKLIEEQEELLFVILWFAIIFIFFSLCRCKLASRILPIAHPLALLVGNMWYQYLTAEDDHAVLKNMKAGLRILALFLIVSGSTGLIIVTAKYQNLFFPGLLLSTLLIGSGIIVAKTDCAAKRWTLFFAMPAAIGFFFMLCIHLVSPQLEEWRSTKSFFLVNLI